MGITDFFKAKQKKPQEPGTGETEDELFEPVPGTESQMAPEPTIPGLKVPEPTLPELFEPEIEAEPSKAAGPAVSAPAPIAPAPLTKEDEALMRGFAPKK